MDEYDIVVFLSHVKVAVHVIFIIPDHGVCVITISTLTKPSLLS